MIDHKKIYSNGIVLESSGSTGPKKKIFQTPKKLQASRDVCLDAQNITKTSRIYTVCKISHAAGLLAQTLPALSIGAHVDCVKFNAYNFIKDIRRYTHTHITPLHALAIMKTKGFKHIDLTDITVVCGAEPVSWWTIQSFVEKGAKFIVNWGMTEIGPIAINHKFSNISQVLQMQKFSPAHTTILGSRFYCDYEIRDQELYVKGDISVTNGWIPTGDLVELQNDCLFFKGRKNSQLALFDLTKF